MKALITYALRSRIVIYFICLLLVVGGVLSFLSLGQLEDPVFTVKTAMISTRYPGASPEEVELEVTDKIEEAIQEMVQIKDISSMSRAGESMVKVDIQQQYWADRLPQVWDELRKKVDDVSRTLPPGAHKPLVIDDFGFVYGFVFAITGDGFSYAELEEYAKIIKKEVSLVKDVSRVDFWGVQDKMIYLDISDKQLSELRLTSETVHATLSSQNMVVNGGFVDQGKERFRVAPTGEFRSPEEIGELLLRPAPDDVVSNLLRLSREKDFSTQDFAKAIEEESTAVVRLKDIANVRLDYIDPPINVMRYNGQQAIGLAVAGSDEANIVLVGEALEARIREVLPHLPVGIELHKVAWQSDLVDDAVNGFLVNLIEAIIIVLIVLIIPSGLRMGLLIGSDLILTILGTFIVMAIMDIPLQRMSLGALIIALGMMVDNSIVVADAIAVKIKQGMDRTQAAIESAMQNSFPLFAATLVAVMTFYPIFASREDAGEYCRTLFIVVAASLLLSWAISLFITPLQCVDLLAKPKEEKGAHGGKIFVLLRKVLIRLIRLRVLTILCLAGLLVLSVGGFGFVRQMFFPDSTRPQLMIDYWAPAGTRIQTVMDVASDLEERIMEDEHVQSAVSFIGAGPPRFYLPVEPEGRYPNYSQILVNFESYKDIDLFIERFRPWVLENEVAGMVRLRKYSVGPSNSWPFELRISGPGEASYTTLKLIANEVLTIARQSPLGKDWRTNMQNPVLKLVPEYDQKRGRWSGVTRLDLSNATRRGYDGLPVGLYREGDDLLPIVMRNDAEERRRMISNIETLQIKPQFSTETLPLSQVVTGIVTDWEDPILPRWNRRRSVTVQGGPLLGVTFPQLKASIDEQINSIPLPPGYEFFWDGEADSSTSAQASLIPGVIPAVVIILLLLVIVFNSARPVCIILLTIPFAAIGITAGLLVTNIPFGFMALLGAMSLAGMMNKNIVVLLDAAALNRKEGMSHFDAIVEASVSRARPVLLAAATTILGVAPLLQDVFWISMAITIMAGLAFGSLLTLIAVPVFYSFFYRVKKEKK